MLELLRHKTGMIFLPRQNGRSYLLPDNLRDMVSLIMLVRSMPDPSESGNPDRTMYDNILTFQSYFFRKWVDGLDIAEEGGDSGKNLIRDIRQEFWKMRRIIKR